MKRRSARRSSGGLNTLAWLILASGAAGAQTLEARQYFDIPEQGAGDALNAFSKQSGLRLLFSYDAIEGRRTSAITGTFTPAQVLDKLLAGTGLRYELTEDSVVLIRAPESARSPNGAVSGGTGAPQSSDQETGSEGAQSPASSSSRVTDQTAQVHELTEIVVTGTHIRNVQDHFSPITSVTRDSLDRAGLGRATDYLARLPQNFTGGSGTSPDQRSMGAQMVNLRGLGTEATLTLVNGRRLSPSGLGGEYADISTIPTAALERIDVLTDGASAIYGSDAIAGVVNFILREDYEGNETRFRIGGGDDGSLEEMMAAHTVGLTGDRGRMLLSYEYSTQDELDANDRDFTRAMPDPNEILPNTRRHSAFFSGALNVGARGELFSDAYFARRESRQVFSSFDTRNDRAEVEQVGGTLGAAVDFAGDWRAELSGSIARNDFFDKQFITPAPPTNSGLLQESETRIWSIDAKVDGSLFELPGGMARAVLGAQFRDEKHDSGADFFDADGNPLGVPQGVAHTSREVSAAFTELYLPFVSARNAMPGVQRLSVSIAGRYEDYSDFGSTFNPKFGLLWSPIESVTFRATYGTAFRAPRLAQLVDQITTVIIADYIDPEVPGGMSVAAWVNGSSSDLEPEESTSWTAGIDFEPAFAPGLKLRATYFDIDYDSRIDNPLPEIDLVFLHNFPLPPVRNVDTALIQSFVDSAVFPLINFTQTPFGSNSTIEDVSVLLDSRATNTARSKVSGIDLSASFAFSNRAGDWELFANGNYLFHSEDQFSFLTPVVPRLNTVGNPPDLRVRGGLTWAGGNSAVGLFVNYADNYRDIHLLSGPEKVASWTTVDLSYRYDLGNRFPSGLLSGVTLTASVLNALDRDPPSIGMAVIPGAGTRETPYDAANADPEGRILALQITKQW